MNDIRSIILSQNTMIQYYDCVSHPDMNFKTKNVTYIINARNMK